MAMRARPREEFRWSLAQVADELGTTAPAGSAEITGIAVHTSRVRPGDLYAGLPGRTSHGAQFTGRAEAAGAVALLTDRVGAAYPTSLPTIVVEAPRPALAALSAAFYRRPAESLQLVGVTGTQGKTTATYLAEAGVGATRAAVVGTIGSRIAGQSVDSALTTPESPELQALLAVMREESVVTCAMEVSSHALVQGRVDGLRFDVAVFLNLGRDHLDFHRDLDDYFRAKAMLFTPDRARQAVVSVDDEHGRLLAQSAKVPIQTFSVEGRVADWRAVNIRPDRLGSAVEVHGPGGLVVAMRVPLPGAFNVANAVAVLAALVATGHDPAQVASGIAASTGVPGRMERVEAGQDFTAIVDYAHKPDAIAAVLSALRPVTAGRLIIVLGAGGDRDRGKRPIMGREAATRADIVIVTDDNPRSENPAAIRRELRAGTSGTTADVIEIADRRAAIARAVALARSGDTVVVAGKGHETGQEIAGQIHPFDDRTVLAELIAASGPGRGEGQFR
jgi:UDP-N-acetylmuramoyl-L-alanyl-D-glutamate--2,6-diaminopimelate ligase